MHADHVVGGNLVALDMGFNVTVADGAMGADGLAAFF